MGPLNPQLLAQIAQAQVQAQPQPGVAQGMPSANATQIPMSNMPAFNPGINPLQSTIAPPQANTFSQLGSNLAKSPLGQVFQGKPGKMLGGLQNLLKGQSQRNLSDQASGVAQNFQAQNQQMQNLIKGLTQMLGSRGISNPTLQNAASNPELMGQVTQANANTSED